VPAVSFDRYLRYEELTALLHAFADEHPGLIRLRVIGQSWEGRDIHLLEVTDLSTGEPEDKPAFWCDGNIHASEVSASSAVLKLLQILCEERPEILKERAFYLVPRLCPDGAELALADRPRIVRSSVRPYPFDEGDTAGLERQDIDGDGRILQMRVPDPNGPWVISEEEPRLMRRRKPGERAEAAYRLLPEGLLHHYDGMTLRGQKPKEGLDNNRNFPSAWRIESEQHGAGPYPTSEPEVAAAVRAICERPNICGALTFHTFSGVLLRPPSRMPDDDIPAEDLWTYQELGRVGHEMTGYPAISNFHEFKYHPKEVITGVFDDWMYEHRGVHAWTVEIWSPQRQAGITDYKYIDWFREHPFEHDVQLLKWSDEKLGSGGYSEWRAFDHPQLGEIEIGGWDFAMCWRNPPLEFLEAEIEPLARWAIWHASTGPLLALRQVQVEPFEGAVRIRVAVENRGWLPTNVTQIGADRKLCRGVVGEIKAEGWEPEGAGSAEPDWLLSGGLRQEKGQLRGWSSVPAAGFGWNLDATDDVAVLEWVARSGRAYEIEIRHERAGAVRQRVEA
jgi:murein tripeptide amidase MpaA